MHTDIELERIRPARPVAIATTPPIADRLIAIANSAAFASAISPFRVAVRAANDGATAEGDAEAAQIVAVLTRALELDPEGAVTPEQHIAESIAHALKYDLALRLKGIPYPLRLMTLAQLAFMDVLLKDPHQLIIGIGPTGTGKTHLALAAGLNMLAEGRVGRMVLTRPHILFEGEVMTAPLRAELLDQGQLAPILDELHALIGHEVTKRLFGEGKLEVAPLGYMRGRTFSEAFILVDEAQNLTVSAMHTVVTRLGHGSRMVLTGDPDHVDLHGKELSGLADLLSLIEGKDLAAIHRFERGEIIRNDLVASLDHLYAKRAAARGETHI